MSSLSAWRLALSSATCGGLATCPAIVGGSVPSSVMFCDWVICTAVSDGSVASAMFDESPLSSAMFDNSIPSAVFKSDRKLDNEDNKDG